MRLSLNLWSVATRRRPQRDTTAPTITSASSANCAENATLAHALTANETVTWTITGGVDAARFEISGSTLRWAGNGTKDFEAPNDFNTNNTYIVQVTATDEALNASNQTVTITVTNVLEVTLAALSLDDLTIAEDQVTGTKVGTITGASSGSTITLHAQSNAGMFALDGNDIEVGATPLDFETVPSPTITLRETHADASNSPRDSVITITVTDVAEGPSLGPELLTNGDCSSSTGWTLGEGGVPATISGGKLSTGGTGDSCLAAQTGLVETATNYRIVFTIDAISDTEAYVSVGGTEGIHRTTAGTFSEDIICGGGEDIEFWFILGGAGSFTADNFSAKEIL